MDLESVEANGQPELEAECAEIRQGHSNVHIAEPIDELCENIVDPLDETSFKSELSDKPWKCYICSDDLRNNEDFQQHMEAVHRRSLKCPHCELFFSRKGPLEKHLKVHQTESTHTESIPAVLINPIFCIICDLWMKAHDEVEDHMAIHLNDGPFECPDCADLFEDIKTFQDHTKHHKVKAKKVPGKTTPPTDLNTLENIQVVIEAIEITPPSSPIDNSKPIASYPCDRLFIDEMNLKKHKKIHDGPPKLKKSLPAAPISVDLVPSIPCNICGDKFIDEMNLNQHKKTHDEPPDSSSPVKLQSNVVSESALSCIICNETFSDELNLNEHKKLHAENSSSRGTTHPKPDKKTQSFACDQCDRSFTLAKTLALHIRQGHHSIKPYKCDICDWSFGQSCQLVRHKKKHTGERPYKCEHCDQSFSQKRNFLNHSKIHTNDLSQCKYCDHEFLLGTSMMQHLKKHEGEQIFPCPHCNIPYSAPNYLDLNVKRVHKATFPCMHCDKTYTTVGARNRHCRQHDGIFPYPCTICGKSFTDRTLLKSHQVVHSDTKAFQCSYCGQSFSYSGNLKAHVRKHTGERPYECKICHKTFVRSPNLNEHMRTHTGQKYIKCEICGKDFTSATTFSKHKKIHTGERPYKCHICEKTFRQSIHLKKHIMVHTGEKPFPCETCGRFFRRTDALKIHVKRHHLKKPEKKIEANNNKNEDERIEIGDDDERNVNEGDTMGIVQQIKIEIVDDLWL